MRFQRERSFRESVEKDFLQKEKQEYPHKLKREEHPHGAIVVARASKTDLERTNSAQGN